MISHCLAVIRVLRDFRLVLADQQRRGNLLLNVLDLSQYRLRAAAANQQRRGQQD